MNDIKTSTIMNIDKRKGSNVRRVWAGQGWSRRSGAQTRLLPSREVFVIHHIFQLRALERREEKSSGENRGHLQVYFEPPIKVGPRPPVHTVYSQCFYAPSRGLAPGLLFTLRPRSSPSCSSIPTDLASDTTQVFFFFFFFPLRGTHRVLHIGVTWWMDKNTLTERASYRSQSSFASSSVRWMSSEFRGCICMCV